LPCIPQNISNATTVGPLVSMKESEDDDAASLGALVFFLVVAIYAIAVVVTCSCFIKDKMLLVTPKTEEGGEEGEEAEEDSKDEEEDDESVDEPTTCKERITRLCRKCRKWRKSFTISPKMKDRIKHLFKQLLGSTARLVVLGIFVMSAIGILVLWDVAVARPDAGNSSMNRRAQMRASDNVETPASDPVDRNATGSSTNSSTLVPNFLGGLNRRVQSEDNATTMAPPTMAPPTMAPPTMATEGSGVDNGGVENKIECFAWCAGLEEENMEKRCKIPGCTRCSTCQLDRCAYWCLDVYPSPEDRCTSLACVGCPECDLRPCGEDETTTAAPTPPPRVERLHSETPLASLPEEYISVTWCSLGPWASIAVGVVAFSFHVLACSLAGEWASRYEGQAEDRALEDPNSPEVQASMPRPGFTPANMFKREPQPAPSRLGQNNVRIFNI